MSDVPATAVDPGDATEVAISKTLLATLPATVGRAGLWCRAHDARTIGAAVAETREEPLGIGTWGPGPFDNDAAVAC